MIRAAITSSIPNHPSSRRIDPYPSQARLKPLAPLQPEELLT